MQELFDALTGIALIIVILSVLGAMMGGMVGNKPDWFWLPKRIGKASLTTLAQALQQISQFFTRMSKRLWNRLPRSPWYLLPWVFLAAAALRATGMVIGIPAAVVPVPKKKRGRR